MPGVSARRSAFAELHERVAGLKGLAASGGETHTSRAMEPGFITLAKIVGTLITCISLVPLLFLLSPGSERGEPEMKQD